MTYALNHEHNGIELYFDSKPDQAILSTLKTSGWRWNGPQKCWYTKQTEKALELAKTIAEGKAPEAAPETPKTSAITYHKKVSGYISLETYQQRLSALYDQHNRQRDPENKYKESSIREDLKNYDTEKPYYGLAKQIRHAIVAKSLNMSADRFPARYQAVWNELPTIKGLKPGKVYSASWGYDQTNITTATHYGRAFGLDVLVTGGFGSGDILLKRIDKDGRFSESCMNFSPNTYTDEEIQETNTYASYFGH
jgi:hypothetical protein